MSRALLHKIFGAVFLTLLVFIYVGVTLMLVINGQYIMAGMMLVSIILLGSIVGFAMTDGD